MSSQLPAYNPTGYLGTNDTYPGQIWFRDRAPINARDIHNYRAGDTWIDTNANQIWMLSKIVTQPAPLNKIAQWMNISGAGAAGIITLQGDIGGVVAPDGVGNVNVVGQVAQGIQTDGTLAANTLTILGIDATTVSKGVSQYNPLDFNVAAGVVSSNHNPTINWQFNAASPTAVPINTAWLAHLPGLNVFNLPAIAPLGTVVYIQGAPGQWTLNCAAGQAIAIDVGHTSTVGGSVSSTNLFDGIQLVCYFPNILWLATSVKGNVVLA